MKITKYILGIAIFASLSLTSCMKEDIDELRSQQAQNAARITALEEWQQTINNNIAALQQLIAALQDMDYVTGVVPFDTPEPGGYRITFSKSGEATIWNGQQGVAGPVGATPVIGVEQDPADGIYYWTVDGEFIESGGQRVPTTGNTPKVTIGTDGIWYISEDGSATDPAPGTGWTSTGVEATGPQGDAIFAPDGVDNSNDDYVIFTLADGTTTITVPKYKSVGVTFDQPAIFMADTPQVITLTSTGTVDPTNIRVVGLPSGWSSSLSGLDLTITPPAAITDGNAGAETTMLVGVDDQVYAMYSLVLSTSGYLNNEIGEPYYERGVEVGWIYRVATDTEPGLILSNNYEERIIISYTGPTAFDMNIGTEASPGPDYNNYNNGKELFDALKTTIPDTWHYISLYFICDGMGSEWFVPIEKDWNSSPDGLAQLNPKTQSDMRAYVYQIENNETGTGWTTIHIEGYIYDTASLDQTQAIGVEGDMPFVLDLFPGRMYFMRMFDL